MADIRMRGLCKAFKDAQVIHNVNLDIEDGEFAVFVGPSGCGKSTLLRLVAGLEDITSGDLFIGGQRVNHLPPAKRGVAMVFQSYALYPHMTVYDNMAFGLKLAKTDRDTIAGRVHQAAQTLQIEHLLERLPKELSGGQRQRVAIGRAIVREPEVFLFDEPLSNLDAALRVRTRIEISRLHQGMDASMIYVTHDQVEAMTLADKIVLLNTGPAVLREGSVAQIGAPLELYHHPCNTFVAGFIGSPTMNFLAAEIERVEPALATVRLADGTRLQMAVDVRGAPAGARVTLGIRPEHAAIDASGTIRASVEYVEHLGEASYLYATAPGVEGYVVVRQGGDVPCHGGDTLALAFPARHCHLFDERGRAFPRIMDEDPLPDPIPDTA